MKKNLPLKVVSPGTQERNFTHIDDIVSALIMIGEDGNGDEYGIGSDESFTILEVAELFGGKIEMLTERKGNRMSANLISTKTKSLGWKPARSLVEFIEKKKENDWEE